MLLSEFAYTLPKKLIAQTPAPVRDQSRLMCLNKKEKTIGHRRFFELETILNPNDVLVLNKSRVIPARLFTREGHEVFLLKQIKGPEPTYQCLVKPGKKFPVGHTFSFDESCRGEVIDILKNSGIRIIRFDAENFEHFLKQSGHTPLPPYIKKYSGNPDRYQTVYSSETQKGSVAAPTAGLHFTTELLENLKKQGISIEYTTLHVGLGTFQPVKNTNIESHTIHSEWFSLDKSATERLNAYKKAGKRILAVGTTSVRVLETCAGTTGILSPKTDETDIFIYPGYTFKFVDALITNFHLPKSTLLMLVCAFAGKSFTLDAYKQAIQEKYRFYSFGDAMLIS